MSEPPGLQYPLGIEAVHWSVGPGTDLVVRVAGRWRRRRGGSTFPTVLAIDTEHRRYRFPALPEPPSIGGAQAGLWQVRFTVPAALAPYLAGRMTLLVGSVSISLPPAVADLGTTTGWDQRSNGHAELGERLVLNTAGDGEQAEGEANALLDWLELELAQSRKETERLRTELGVAERKRREAEQLAHSEAAMRLDLGRDHAARIRRHQADARAAHDLLEATQIHARELAREVEILRRAAAEQGESPRESPRVRPSSPARPQAVRLDPDPGARARVLASELAIAHSAPRAPHPVASPAPGRVPGLELELAMRARVASADPALAWRPREDPVEERLAGALLRLAAGQAETGELMAHGPAAQEPSARDSARAAYLTDAIDAIARQIEAVRAAVALLPTSAPGEAGRERRAAERGAETSDRAAGAVAPDRLAAALDRLRQECPSPEGLQSPPARSPGRQSGPVEAPGQVASRWLLRALKRMLREDPALVGGVITGLLPAQGLVVAGPVRYDLALSDAGCRAVTVRDEEVRVEVLGEPRSLDDVDFRIEGDLAGLGRLLVYGSLRRRVSRRVARVRGDRHALSALDWLVREPRGLPALHGAGLRLDPEPALQLVAHMIDPAWTAGERFTVGHESPQGGARVYLQIRDGAPPRVTREPPLGPVGTTICSSGELLLALLAGGTRIEGEVRGASEPVALVRKWIARAQRDS